MHGQANTSQDKYIQRGRIVDAYARIEDRLAPAIERLVQAGLCKKAPYLPGEKFRVVIEHARMRGLWQHPDHAEKVLRDLEPYLRSRGILIHGIFEFDPTKVIIRKSGQLRADAATIAIDSFQELINTLERLASKLERQPLARLKAQEAA